MLAIFRNWLLIGEAATYKNKNDCSDHSICAATTCLCPFICVKGFKQYSFIDFHLQVSLIPGSVSHRNRLISSDFLLNEDIVIKAQS